MQYVKFENIETHRLILRDIRLEDLPEYQRIYSNPEVTRYMLFDPHKDQAQSLASLEKILARYRQGRCYRWGISLKQNARLIGIIELLRFDEQANSCSFAYMLDPEFWNRGYGTEALQAVIRFAFEQIEISLIQVDHMSGNPASGTVMRKAGMTYTGRIEGKYQKNSVSQDALCYEIRKERDYDGK